MAKMSGFPGCGCIMAEYDTSLEPNDVHTDSVRVFMSAYKSINMAKLLVRLLGYGTIAVRNRSHVAGIYALGVKDVVFRGF